MTIFLSNSDIVSPFSPLPIDQNKSYIIEESFNEETISSKEEFKTQDNSGKISGKLSGKLSEKFSNKQFKFTDTPILPQEISNIDPAHKSVLL